MPGFHDKLSELTGFVRGIDAEDGFPHADGSDAVYCPACMQRLPCVCASVACPYAARVTCESGTDGVGWPD